MTPLRAFLRKHRRISIDTSVFICLIQSTPVYAPLAQEVFAWLEETRHSAVTSTITMTELLVQPYRDGDQDMVNRYFATLTEFPNLQWLAPDLMIADTAAGLRAKHRLRTPDALQLATGICGGATAAITNDSAWNRVGEIDVCVLGESR